MTHNTREKINKARKEDAEHLLYELWDAEPDETFYKIFTRETKKGIQNLLLHSKAELKEPSCREDDGSINGLIMHEVGNIRMLVRYRYNLISEGILPEDTAIFRFSCISKEDWDTFVNHPNSIRLISTI